MSDYSSLRRRARRARCEAENDAATEIFDWYKAEKQKINDDPELGDIDRSVKMRELMMEFGRRSKNAIGRAKRQNTIPKMLEREVLAEIEAERAGLLDR